jgi:antitoxin ParD1/3/4
MPTKQITRNIALTPHFDKYVKSKVDSGRYQSASEVIRESLRLMEQHEQDRQRTLAGVREKIRAGYEQLQRGETVDPDDVLAELRAMSKAARKPARRGR